MDDRRGLSHSGAGVRRVLVFCGICRIRNGAADARSLDSVAVLPAIYFFLVHGGIIVAGAVLVFGKAGALGPAAIWRAFGLLVVYALAVGAFNAAFWHQLHVSLPQTAEPFFAGLAKLGPWPVYLWAGAAVGLVLFWALWLPVRAAAKRRA